MDTSSSLKSIVKPRVIAMPDGILVLVFTYAGESIFHLLGLENNDSHNILLALLLFSLVLVSWLVFFVYKFHIVQKALLEIQPDFYTQKEFNKWFDYYANKKEKNSNK